MSTRSVLLRKILRAWDYSQEGQNYLASLIDSDPELDSGDVLREAVLEWTDAEELPREQIDKADKALDESCAELTPAQADLTRKAAGEIAADMVSMRSALRDKVEALRSLRHKLGCGRFEVLKLIASAQRDQIDESQDLWKRIAEIERLSAKVAALCRTTAVPVDIEAEWRRVAPDAQAPGWTAGNKDTSEELDHYYSYQVATRLEQIVDRASALDPVQLKVTDNSVRGLFQEAHEVYLYGFDVACIALCRSLAEHALKSKLSPVPTENLQLGSLIERAAREKLLEGPELDSARKVARAGNDVMHNLSNLRRTAQEILDCMRLVLNRLYAPDIG